MGAPCSWSLETWNEFLTDNFHLLSKLTKVDSFLAWLRQKRVLTEYDEEDILSRNTSAMRSARLIDTIKFKGIKGAEAYMEVVEWVYPEVYCSITGRSPRDPPGEFQCDKGEVSSFRKSRILLDQLQKCMGTILEENNWKREDIIQLRETVQRLKLENESMMEERKLLNEKMERSFDEADELKLLNSELQQKLEALKDDNVRQSTHIFMNMNWRNGSVTSTEDLRKEKSNNSSPISGTCSIQNCNELSSQCKHLEESLIKYEQALAEKQSENEKQRREIDQLLDLNQRLKSDYQKAVKTSQNQQETLDFYKAENERLSSTACIGGGSPIESPDIIPQRKLERKKVVKKKSPDWALQKIKCREVVQCGSIS